ncbi:hypothetical protein FGO68_gene2503 [Halteria grandinella]|uniref:Uncharacterized protein n=1 Tax=Halteria grandinella TaxID=5974 RepID=A0A8J8T9R8_HALGN|nr:hypothetical protein FGO68_gene2503 [Halteria grandinella]
MLSKILREKVKVLKLEIIELRMKIMEEHVQFKRLLLLQDSLTKHMVCSQQDLLLELILQLAESLSSLKEAPPGDLQRLLLSLEQKLSTFLSNTFNLKPATQTSSFTKTEVSLNRLLHEAFVKLNQERPKVELDLVSKLLSEQQLPQKSIDPYHFRTLSEIEDYVYKHLNKAQQNERDVSEKELMGVTESLNSNQNNLSGRIKLLIKMDQAIYGKDSEGSMESISMEGFKRGGFNLGSMLNDQGDGLLIVNDNDDSVIKVDEGLVEFLLDNNNQILDSLDSEERKKKIKKIEFSQSIKKAGEPRRAGQELVFTHQKLDALVLEGSLKGTNFNLDKAKELLKKVVIRKNADTSSSALSYDLPQSTLSTARDVTSIKSTIDKRFNEKSVAKIIEQLSIQSSRVLQDTALTLAGVHMTQQEQGKPQSIVKIRPKIKRRVQILAQEEQNPQTSIEQTFRPRLQLSHVQSCQNLRYPQIQVSPYQLPLPQSSSLSHRNHYSSQQSHNQSVDYQSHILSHRPISSLQNLLYLPTLQTPQTHREERKTPVVTYSQFKKNPSLLENRMKRSKSQAQGVTQYSAYGQLMARSRNPQIYQSGEKRVNKSMHVKEQSVEGIVKSKGKKKGKVGVNRSNFY